MMVLVVRTALLAVLSLVVGCDDGKYAVEHDNRPGLHVANKDTEISLAKEFAPRKLKEHGHGLFDRILEGEQGEINRHLRDFENRKIDYEELGLRLQEHGLDPHAHFFGDFDLKNGSIENLIKCPSRGGEDCAAPDRMWLPSLNCSGPLNLGRCHVARVKFLESGEQHDLWKSVFLQGSQEKLQAAATVAIFKAQGTKLREDGSLDLPSPKVVDTVKGDLCGGHPICEGKRWSEFNKLLKNPGGAVCGGVLVADNVVATSFHCVKGRGRSDLRFVFGFQSSGRMVSDAGRTVSDKGHHYSGKPVACDAKRDWALVQLDGDVPSSIAIPVEIGDEVIARGERRVAYSFGHALGSTRLRSGEGGSTPSYIEACGERKINSTLDRFPFSSGSPVFGTRDHRLLGLLRNNSQGGSFALTRDGSCCHPLRGSYNSHHCTDEVTPATDFKNRITEAMTYESGGETLPDSCKSEPSVEAASPPLDPG